MQQSKFRKYSILGQIGLWTILFLINYADELPYSSVLASAVFALNNTFMIVGTVYVHYFLVFPLFFKKPKLIYFVAVVLLMTFFIFLYFSVDAVLPFETNYEYDEEGPLWKIYAYDYLLLTLILAVSSLYYFVQAWFDNISKEALLKNEKLYAELNFLKSQINPHFLFNTLNNIYSFAQTDNPKTAPMLERLSSILRFMVYDCSEDKVELNKELNAVEDLFELYKMKNSKQSNIELVTEGVKGFHLIAPLIIVNLVENAFKHSDALSNKDGFIKINIAVDEKDSCLLEIFNSIKRKIDSDSPYQGLGLENIKKRLKLQYGEDCTITEKIENNHYYLKLWIPLRRKQ